ncbi:MAG: hypothetical protein WDW38_011593 [Sanguina aurantia]
MTLWLLTCTRHVAHNGSEERLHVLLDQANFSSASLLQQLHMSILGQGRTPTQEEVELTRTVSIMTSPRRNNCRLISAQLPGVTWEQVYCNGVS